jgi:hypothetical protein
MAEFSGRIISAEYMNTDYSLIKVRYNDDGINAIYHLEVDPNNADFQALEADGWDAEKIIDATAESKRVQSNAWNLEVNAAAQQIAQEMIGTTVLKKEKSELDVKVKDAKIALDKSQEKLDKLGGQEFDTIQRSKNAIFQFLWDADDNKDELFKFKLWALELDFVKTADKSVKSSLRKAKTIIDGLVILKSIK